MKRSIIGSILGAATVAAVLAVGPGGMASATSEQESGACYEQVPVIEYKYTRTTPTTESEYKKEVRTETFKTEFRYAKYTQTRIAVNKNDNNGPWGPWSTWTAWGTYKSGSGYVNGWGAPAGEILEGPAYHGSGKGFPEAPRDYYWQRQYRYQKVAERPVSTGFETSYEYQWSLTAPGSPWVATGNTRPGTPIVEGPTDFLPGPPDGDGWVEGVEQTRYVDGEQIPCSEKPKDDVTYTEWVDGQYGCGDTTVVQSRTKTTTPYVLDENHEWVPDADSAVTVKETQLRNLTVAEQTTCGIQTFPVQAITDDPTVDCNGVVNLPTSMVGYRWETQTDGTYKAVADPGYYLIPAVKIFDPGDVSPRTDCGDVASKPPVVAPPAVAPPAAAPPAVAPPAQTPAAGATQLPSTGSSSWTLALIALVTLLGGTGLVRLSRRPTD